MPKKRSAPNQAGPSPKKAHKEKPARSEERKPLSKPSKPDALTAKRKRPQPVTADLSDESGSDEEEEEEEEVSGELPQSETEKPQSKNTAESHQAQRALMKERKAAKPNSSLVLDAKRIWHQAHKKDISKSERQTHIASLMKLLRGKVQDIVIKHDASRIVQTLVKHGGQTEREEVAVELKGRYLELAQGKYSKFLVLKLISTCPTYRNSIYHEFQSHILRLLLHRESSRVIADAFELYATASERSLLLREFYGKEVNLFDPIGSSGPLKDGEKEQLRQGLKGALSTVNPQQRKRILASMKENLDLIFNNPDKGAVAYSIVHRATMEYLNAVDELEEEAEIEKYRRGLFDSCQELLAEMVHTKDGSGVVRYFLAWGTAKDRKQIVKVLKPHIERICADDEAQLVLFTALDVIDDTKMVAKSIVSEIVSRAKSLVNSPQGRRSLFYLLVPRSSRHFTPAQVAILAEMDPIKAKTSHKEDSIRKREIIKFASAGLLELLEDEKCAETIIRDPAGSLFVGDLMLHADGDRTKATEILLSLLTAPYPAASESSSHIIDLSHVARLFKSLLQGGHYSMKTRTVIRVAEYPRTSFASAWLKTVGQQNTIAMAQGNAAFVIAALCEAVKAGGNNGDLEVLRSWFGGEVTSSLDSSNVRGKDVLMEGLALLQVSC